MKKFLFLCLFVGLSAINASAQFFQWAKKQERNSGSISVACGNSLVATTGTFFDSTTFGNQTFTAVDSMDHYLAVNNHSGMILWAKQIINGGNGANFGQPLAVTLDANQNVIIAGYFVDSLYIGSLIFKSTTANASGVFVAKFSPTGSLLWAQRSDISQRTWQTRAIGNSVTSDVNGNIFVAGDFSNSVSFDTSNLTANGMRDAFVVKYNSSGVFQWAINTPSNSVEHVIKIKAASNGDVYLLTINPSPIPTNNGYAVLKISASGNILWNSIVSTIGFNYYPNLTLDNQDNAYVIANYNMNVTIGSTTLTPSSTKTNVFLAKVNSLGTWRWLRTIVYNIDTGSYAMGASIVYTNNNELVVSGTFSGSPQFNNTTITLMPVGWENTYVAKLDTAGTAIWVNNSTSTSININTDLSSDDNGNIFIAGHFFQGSTQFSASTLNTSSGIAGYLTKVTHEANIISGTVFFDTNNNGIKDPSETPSSQVVLQSIPGTIYGITNLNGT